MTGGFGWARVSFGTFRFSSIVVPFNLLTLPAFGCLRSSLHFPFATFRCSNFLLRDPSIILAVVPLLVLGLCSLEAFDDLIVPCELMRRVDALVQLPRA